MWSNLLIGGMLLIFSIFVHGFATRFVMKLAIRKAARPNFRIHSKELLISIIVIIMWFASFIEAVAWASTYLYLGAIQGFEEALYFSIVSFTTLGYGDVLLADEFRLLGSLEAANGIIIFGWSTAIIMAVVQKFFFKSNNS